MLENFIAVADDTAAQYHAPRLKRWQHRVDVDDLKQESALRLLQRNQGDSDTHTARAAICFCAIDMTRRITAGVRGSGKVASLESIEYDSPDDLDSPELSVDVADEMEVLRKRMEVALSFIPEKLARYVRMRFFEGLTVREIAERQSQSIDAVDALVRRGVKALKEYGDDIENS